MIILVKRYLTPFNLLLSGILLSLFIAFNAQAKIDVSPLFIQVSDAMDSVKKNETETAMQVLSEISTKFSQFDGHNSPMGKTVSTALTQVHNTPTLANLENLSKALINFEKEQNPVDRAEQRSQFAKRVMPVFQQLEKAVKNQDIDAIQNEFKRFNTTWTVNELPVRETSLGHYGQIETAMTLLRVAMVSDPPNYAEMEKQSANLAQALQDFKAGNILEAQVSTSSNAPQDLVSGIKLLQQAYNKFEQNKVEEGRFDLTLFIQQWPIFEGEVSTRDGDLYSRVESELPIILAKGNETGNMQNFQQLISQLNQIDAGNYTMFDAMLILLREGLEALLIVTALLASLKAANHPSAKRWVYAGAGVGVATSIISAIALQQFFPVISAGTNREIIEGSVGIVAVTLMLFIGAWLHSKSSLSGWKKFVDRKVTTAIATGSLLSMFGLSFLSVFREGAETILFYVGMLPLIALKDLIIGIVLAIVILLLIAFVINRSTKYLPLHHVFKAMTWLIYLLAFKILGVSIHALQLTNTIPTNLLDNIPNIAWIGFYATWEGILSQLVYLICIPIITKLFKS